VEGVQSQKVMAVMKHFALNSQEIHRNDGSSNIDERTFQEIYLPPFAGAVDAGVASVMCGYNQVNGVHDCANGKLLNRDLKERMGFNGFVMSDWWAIHDTGYQVGGLDMSMPGNDGCFADAMLAASGPTALDDMVTRVLAGMISTGVMDAPALCAVGVDCDDFLFKVNASSAEHGALARDIAAQSIVLLKNTVGSGPNKVLPLGQTPGQTIAVVGAVCDSDYNLDALTAKWDLGNYYVLGGSGRARCSFSDSNLHLMMLVGVPSLTVTTGNAV
jgi:beta-glucosidase